jgi:hypothetical protein
MDEAGISAAVLAAIAQTGAAGIKDMGKVMAALKAAHGAALDMSKAGAVVSARDWLAGSDRRTRSVAARAVPGSDRRKRGYHRRVPLVRARWRPCGTTDRPSGIHPRDLG